MFKGKHDYNYKTILVRVHPSLEIKHRISYPFTDACLLLSSESQSVMEHTRHYYKCLVIFSWSFISAVNPKLIGFNDSLHEIQIVKADSSNRPLCS